MSSHSSATSALYTPATFPSLQQPRQWDPSSSQPPGPSSPLSLFTTKPKGSRPKSRVVTYGGSWLNLVMQWAVMERTAGCLGVALTRLHLLYSLHLQPSEQPLTPPPPTRLRPDLRQLQRRINPGTQKNGGGENKIQYSKTQPQVGLVSQGGNLSSSLVTLGPGWKWQCATERKALLSNKPQLICR
ncbi:hypothetical protein NQZ68_033461 [Dissostichus eleginoides]|nr:hypothetical protein NQZ68_033461 [Dissostichus eleginoides]